MVGTLVNGEIDSSLGAGFCASGFWLSDILEVDERDECFTMQSVAHVEAGDSRSDKKSVERKKRNSIGE